MKHIIGLIISILISLVINFIARSSSIKSVYLYSFKGKSKNLIILLRIILILLIISFFLPFILIDGHSTSYFELALNNNYLAVLIIISFIATLFLLFSQDIKRIKFSFFILCFGYIAWLFNGLILDHKFQYSAGPLEGISIPIFIILYMQIILPTSWTEEKFLTEGWVDAPVTKGNWISVFKNIVILYIFIFISAIITLIAILFGIPELLTNSG